MKTVSINLYSINELNEAAQQKALEKFNYSAEYNWADDAIESLKKVTEHFNAELSDYSIDWNNAHQSSVRFTVSDDELSENELSDLIISMGTYNVETLRGNGDCKFTGVCFDENVCDGIRAAYFGGERDIKELLKAGYWTWIKDCVNDFEYQQSMESFIETCEANEYTFEADGTMNNG